MARAGWLLALSRVPPFPANPALLTVPLFAGRALSVLKLTLLLARAILAMLAGRLAGLDGG